MEAVTVREALAERHDASDASRLLDLQGLAVLGLDVLARAQAVDHTTVAGEVSEPELQALTA